MSAPRIFFLRSSERSICSEIMRNVAGEEGGDLPATFLIISEQMERSDDLRKKIRGALIYPSIILIAIFGIGALLMTQVVPTLASTFKDMGAELPSSTKAIIAVSDFLVHYTTLALIIVVGTISGVYAAV